MLLVANSKLSSQLNDTFIGYCNIYFSLIQNIVQYGQTLTKNDKQILY